jgi:hypothetical protein
MRLALTAIAFLAAGAVQAATLDIAGDYGTPAGCKYLKDHTQWEEGVTTLTPNEYKDFVTICEYLQVLPAGDGSRIVTLLCQQELDVVTIDIWRVVQVPDHDAYSIYNQAGDRLVGELARCE